MPYLTAGQKNDLSDEIFNAIGYSPNIRKIFLSEVFPVFRNLMVTDPNEAIQLDLDLDRLNNTPRLTDGTIPFFAWLRQAARYVRPFPDALKLVNNSIAIIEGQVTKAAPSVPIQPPSAAVIGKVIREKIVHGNDLLSYAWLEAGMRAGTGVACLKVPRYDNGQPTLIPGGGPAIYSGTGWLLTRDLLITNHHVIQARGDNEPNASASDLTLQGVGATANFDFNADNLTGTPVSITALEAVSATFDYAILRLKNPVDRRPPARRLSTVAVNQSEPEAVNIIQHPFGYSKKVAFRNNHIFEAGYPKVLYFTDTEKGSSGSPVFNDNWEVIALHRASQSVDTNYQGKDTKWVNEGVQLKAIFDDLAASAPALSAEILAAAAAGN